MNPQLTWPIVISLRVHFSSSHEALLRADNSPVKLMGVFGHQNMTIPYNVGERNITVLVGDDNSLFQAFSDLYGLFTSTTSNDLQPYLTIARSSFDDLIKALHL